MLRTPKRNITVSALKKVGGRSREDVLRAAELVGVEVRGYERHYADNRVRSGRKEWVRPFTSREARKILRALMATPRQ
jgi:hypothetical protein